MKGRNLLRKNQLCGSPKLLRFWIQPYAALPKEPSVNSFASFFDATRATTPITKAWTVLAPYFTLAKLIFLAIDDARLV
jgi:hypothetical protein